MNLVKATSQRDAQAGFLERIGAQVRVASGFASAARQLPAWVRERHAFNQPVAVDAEMLGVNIATSDDPDCDDYVVASLRELGVRHVRMDFSYGSRGGPAERLLHRVLAEGFGVFLDILPPLEDAQVLHRDMAAQERWRRFVRQVLADCGDGLVAVEIGATPNRGKWSGFSMGSFMAAWVIAAEEAEGLPIPLAGPNISDFEPLYNWAFLRAMRRSGRVSDIHTNNLFVERAIQPELYDNRVFGRWAGQRFKLNLFKKTRVLASISQAFGIDQTYCTYTCWTLKRLKRWNVDAEDKSADFLLRYLTIAAASGAFNRVYWGPLICSRDGLISCANDNYPQTDNVSFYESVRGEVKDFRKTAAFDAFANAARLLQGTRCVQGFSGDNGLFHFIFEAGERGELHVLWCLDRSQTALAQLYPDAALANATGIGPSGQTHPQMPLAVTERPLILQWPAGCHPYRPSPVDLEAVVDVQRDGILVRPLETRQTVKLARGGWRGVVAVPQAQDFEAHAAQFLPQQLEQLGVEATLRDQRNRVWNVEIPSETGLQTVKLNRARGIKRLSYYFLDSKGKRHWNNACEMLRRGVSTPEPLAFFEQERHSGVRENYYISCYIEDSFSCRDVFAAFKQGATSFRGRSRQEWLEALALFVANMHRRRVVHGDLSAGNILITDANNKLEFYLIDIGRARVRVPGKRKFRERMADLKRICFKMTPEDREFFMQAYGSAEQSSIPWGWELSVLSYQWKIGAKRALKGRRKRRRHNGQAGKA